MHIVLTIIYGGALRPRWKQYESETRHVLKLQIFGKGPEARRHGTGLHPLLCNLQLAVARVLNMSGAAELIAQIIEEGDDLDFAHIYIAPPAFCDVLTAQLLASGRALLY
ncbi:hypothetical protein F5887DRAFT_936222 [Amanita rubescens]|nr:hypothetical protein F5887DRAFT_936222 [Amanita rubescens]